MTYKPFASASLLLLFLSSSSVYAHSIWSAVEHGKTALVYGFASGSEPYSAEKIISITGWKQDHQWAIAPEKQASYVTIDTQNSDKISVTFDGGYWSTNAAGKTVNQPKSQLADAIKSIHYLKYNVTILDAKAEANQPVGQTLEIVPAQNPLTMHRGDTLSVQVLYQGKPLANAAVLNDFINLESGMRKRTDDQGKVNLTIRNSGLNVFEVSYKTQINRPEADTEGLSATLSFTLHNHSH